MTTTIFWDEPSFTIPYYCDDCNTWHKTKYFSGFEGKKWTGNNTVFFATTDEDGNQEENDYKPADVLLKESETQWVEYSKWVITNNGNDPLDEFIVSCDRKIRYTITFQKSIMGFRVVSWRQAKKVTEKTPSGTINNTNAIRNAFYLDVPKCLKEYFNLTFGNSCIYSKEKNLDILCKNNPDTRLRNAGNRRFGCFTVTIKTPRSEHAIKRDIIRAARRHLKKYPYPFDRSAQRLISEA